MVINKTLLMKECLGEVNPYLKCSINNLKKSDIKKFNQQ